MLVPPSAQLNPPTPVLDIARRLEEAGYETWCVGGAVRDALLGRRHLDWDLATAATPDEVRRIFGGRRTIPIGVEYGTVGVLDRHGRLHEVTTFRRDIQTDGRHAVVEYGASLDDDLARRDFTINVIAYHPGRQTLRDPYGGRRDLELRLVRAVGDPQARIREDRLRALRAIRFAGRLGFAIEPATWDAIVASAPWLRRLSSERVKQELEKTMDQLERPSAALSLWAESGAIAVLIPALAAVTPETLLAVDCVPLSASQLAARQVGRRLTRLAALFSDLRPQDVSSSLTALRFSKSDAAHVSRIVGAWHATAGPIEAQLARQAVSDEAVRRWVSEIGRLDLPMTMRVAEARWSARRRSEGSAPSVGAVRALYRRMLDSRFRDPLDVSDLAIDGDDLRRAGIPPGPVMGKILQALLDRVLRDPSHNRSESLIEEARRIHRESTKE